MTAARVMLESGAQLDCDVEDNPLGVRFWTWTEYHVRPYPGRQLCECMSEVVWCDDPVATHYVLPLGYHEDEDGRSRLLIALPDGRFRMVSAHTVFPILDDAEKTEGAEQFHSEVMARIAVAPTLF